MGFLDQLRSLFGGRTESRGGTATVSPPEAGGSPAPSGDLASSGSPAPSGDIHMGMVMELIGSDGSGLPALLEKIRAGGLGEFVGTWVGTGDNMPVSTKRLVEVLGPDRVAEVARKFGVSSDVAATSLTNTLPRVIDKLTPEGRVPDAETLRKHLSAQFKL